MADQTQLYNLALSYCADYRVTSPDEDSEAARYLNQVYEPTRDAVLRAHGWDSAKTRASLAADSATPAWGYVRAFTLPTDPYCLRVLAVDTDLPWQREGRKILTDEIAPLNILHIARLTEVGDFDPLLFDALAVTLASRVAYRLTESRTLQADLTDQSRRLIASARSVSAQEGSDLEPVESGLITERYL